MVTYSEDKKYAYFGGLSFCRDEKTGYYLNSTERKRLHRCVYEAANGKIPDGYQVHHVDHNKGNNEPDNLVLLTAEEHSKLHGEEAPDELRAFYRKNIAHTARPAASAWHKSAAGREWHRTHFKNTKDALFVKKVFRCKMCGKEYEATSNGNNAFCSNACKSAWRRKSGADNEERICVVCGKQFEVNKYSKAKCCSRSCVMRLRHRK